MNILINWLLSALVIIAGAYILPGVKVDSFTTALVLAIVLGIINSVLKPVLIILTLPITILSLGLFALVINALLIMLATVIVPGFKIDSFWWALLYGIVLSILNWFVFSLTK